jgi:hypothetical protein
LQKCENFALNALYGRPNRVAKRRGSFFFALFGYTRAPSALFLVAFGRFWENFLARRRFFRRDSNFRRRRKKRIIVLNVERGFKIEEMARV